MHYKDLIEFVMVSGHEIQIRDDDGDWDHVADIDQAVQLIEERKPAMVFLAPGLYLEITTTEGY